MITGQPTVVVPKSEAPMNDSENIVFSRFRITPAHNKTSYHTKPSKTIFENQPTHTDNHRPQKIDNTKLNSTEPNSQNSNLTNYNYTKSQKTTPSMATKQPSTQADSLIQQLQ
jgi:hypothetical protein